MAQCNNAIEVARAENHIDVVSFLALKLKDKIKIEDSMPPALQRTIRALKNYDCALTLTNFYQFFKATGLNKDTKRNIIMFGSKALGLDKLRAQLPKEVDNKMVIKGLLSFKETYVIKEETPTKRKKLVAKCRSLFPK